MNATAPVAGSHQRPAATDTRQMDDGEVLFLRHWPVDNARRGVLLVHGLGEHSGRYAEVASWFNRRGLDVCAYDQRGHGRSTGARGALHRADDLLTDLTAIFADYAKRFDRPPLLVGHSMGGLVVARAVLDGRVVPNGLVMSSPALRSLESGFIKRLVRVFTFTVPRLPLTRSQHLQWLSHDPAVAARVEVDSLCSRRITPRLADFIFRAGASCIADASRLAVPTLLMAAGTDHLVDPDGSRDFAAAAQDTERVTYRAFPSCFHELFNEAEPKRSEVMHALATWLDTLPHG
ncbi:alpha/beta hydrolase [Oleiagrimonas sp.]|jgi:alpha-beta hydrolase superfamily lysophospholipase|uniref:alpha/beta hydrolase n=1 Tax=Oleiagrimonas sp. TaxID=2010330 RepID=UPI002619F5DD|nr:alpha/beta hydrolase [Oleiagrimonas sp.]MDA3913787.1 lysophospholipase [Oleiagrimonas sp.]